MFPENPNCRLTKNVILRFTCVSRRAGFFRRAEIGAGGRADGWRHPRDVDEPGLLAESAWRLLHPDSIDLAGGPPRARKRDSNPGPGLSPRVWEAGPLNLAGNPGLRKQGSLTWPGSLIPDRKRCRGV